MSRLGKWIRLYDFVVGELAKVKPSIPCGEKISRQRPRASDRTSNGKMVEEIKGRGLALNPSLSRIGRGAAYLLAMNLTEEDDPRSRMCNKTGGFVC